MLPEISMNKKSVVIFCIENPFRKQTGYYMRVRQTIDSLRDYRIRVLCFGDKYSCTETNGIALIELKKDKFSLIKMLKGYGISSSQSFYSEKTITEIEAVCNDPLLECIIMEGFYFSGFAKVLSDNFCRIIMDLHNYEPKRLASSLFHLRSLKRNLLVLAGLIEYFYTQRKMDKYIWKYWMLTEEEKKKLIRTFGVNESKIDVIPNSIRMEKELSGFEEMPINRDPDRLIFSGNYSYPPNQQAARIITSRLLPRLLHYNKNIRVYITGPYAPAWLIEKMSPNLVVTGYVEDLSEYFNKSYLFIAPIINGGGMKFKVIQALLSGLPVIGTNEALSGIDLSKTKYFKPVEIKDFPEKVIELIRDRDLYLKWASEGNELAKEQLSFSKVKSKMESSLSERREWKN